MKYLLIAALILSPLAAEAKGKKSKPAPVTPVAVQPAPAPAPAPAPRPTYMEQQIAKALTARPSVGTYSAAAALQSGGVAAAEVFGQ